MKKKSVFIALLLMVSVALSLFMQNNAFAKKPVTLRLVIPTPPGDWPQTIRDEDMAKRFNARTNGKYKIEVITGTAVAKLPEYFDAVRVGIVEMQFSNWGLFSFLDSRLGLLELPFLFNNNEALNMATTEMTDLFDPVLQDKFNAKAVMMFNTGGCGFWTQKPVRIIKDLEGMMIGSVSPPASVLIKELGASPVTIPFMDLYESMQKKIIDGSAMSVHGGIQFHFTDVCKYFTAFFGIPSPAGYSVNLDAWNKMPEDIQTILLEEAKTAAEWMNKVVVGPLPKSDLKALKKRGVKIYFMPAKERAKWAKQLEAYTNGELEKHGELGKKFKAIVEKANKKYPYVPGKTAM
ncbi:MAG: TRAP transporter substrate-binding protein DctP [Spirochaetes bacterium]|nr:TRAP transporter substrate-binding protein DctP [Spirochaetota bacterium]